MPTQRIKQQVASAIENPDLRKAIRVMDNIREAHEVMCTLPAPILEVLRDELLRMAQDRTGARGKLKQAWYEFAQRALEDARTRERKDVLGLYQSIKRPWRHPLRGTEIRHVSLLERDGVTGVIVPLYPDSQMGAMTLRSEAEIAALKAQVK
jgi:hypothetical protein